MQSCLQNISKICVEEPYTEEYPCYPDYLKEIGPYFGIWCLFISFLGMFGNLLTMLAIPYAANRKKYVMSYLMKYFVSKSIKTKSCKNTISIAGLDYINRLDRQYSY